MSVYDIKEKISTVTKVYYRKKYNPDYIVAKFYIKDKEINYYYKDYKKEHLISHLKSPMYSKKLVDIDFWNPSFCNPDHLSENDIDKIIENNSSIYHRESYHRESGIVVGYLVTLIGIYNMIFKSYTTENYDKVLENINFDKNILRKMLNQTDLVINFNYSLVKLINSIYNNDNISEFLITPSGRFRLTVRDMEFILDKTPRVHEISQMIFDSVDSKLEILNYYKELLNICGKIYSPGIITSYNAEDVLLNILKLDVNLDLYENIIIDLLILYSNKGGSLDIDFDFSVTEKYQNIIPILDTFREYLLF